MKINTKKLKKASKNTNGNITMIAKNLDVDRRSLYEYFDRNPEDWNIIEEEREKVKDTAESKIVKAINDGDMRTVRWFAERKLSDRGYSNKTEISGEQGKSIDIQHNFGEKILDVLSQTYQENTNSQEQENDEDDQR